MSIDPAVVEAALDAETQHMTNGLCHFGVECGDCDCWLAWETSTVEHHERERARMRHILATAAPLIARATADAIAEAIEADCPATDRDGRPRLEPVYQKFIDIARSAAPE